MSTPPVQQQPPRKRPIESTTGAPLARTVSNAASRAEQPTKPVRAPKPRERVAPVEESDNSAVNTERIDSADADVADTVVVKPPAKRVHQRAIVDEPREVDSAGLGSPTRATGTTNPGGDSDEPAALARPDVNAVAAATAVAAAAAAPETDTEPVSPVADADPVPDLMDGVTADDLSYEDATARMNAALEERGLDQDGALLLRSWNPQDFPIEFKKGDKFLGIYIGGRRTVRIQNMYVVKSKTGFLGDFDPENQYANKLAGGKYLVEFSAGGQLGNPAMTAKLEREQREQMMKLVALVEHIRDKAIEEFGYPPETLTVDVALEKSVFARSKIWQLSSGAYRRGVKAENLNTLTEARTYCKYHQLEIKTSGAIYKSPDISDLLGPLGPRYPLHSEGVFMYRTDPDNDPPESREETMRNVRNKVSVRDLMTARGFKSIPLSNMAAIEATIIRDPTEVTAADRASVYKKLSEYSSQVCVLQPGDLVCLDIGFNITEKDKVRHIRISFEHSVVITGQAEPPTMPETGLRDFIPPISQERLDMLIARTRSNLKNPILQIEDVSAQ